MKVYLLTFATSEFYSFQQDLRKSAEKFGIRDHFLFTEKDLKKTPFYLSNKKIFQFKRGFGFWLWKPYFIDQCLQQIDEDDILLYADSGSLLINDPSPLIKLCIESTAGIMAFDCWPLINAQWTKNDTFVNMGLDSEFYRNATHVIATVIVFQKNKFSRQFVGEWLREASNFHSLSDLPSKTCKQEPVKFVKHMGDQPIFSLLVKKHGLQTFRNPSKWGNFLKMPDYRVEGEYVGMPYHLSQEITDYRTEPYYNSPYGTIFEFNRMQNAKKIKFFDKVASYFKVSKTG